MAPDRAEGHGDRHGLCSAERGSPTDVSVENLEFDIRFVDEKKWEIRYIEVEESTGNGTVALTQNEWFKAQRFRQAYYLYVVMNTVTGPQLYIVKNPAESLAPEERVRW